MVEKPKPIKKVKTRFNLASPNFILLNIFRNSTVDRKYGL